MNEAQVVLASRALLTEMIEILRNWSQVAIRLLGNALAEAARSLAVESMTAASFPRLRASALQAADRALIALRTHLTVAADLNLLSANDALRLAAAIEPIGRMIGGWRRAERKKRSRAEVPSG